MSLLKFFIKTVEAQGTGGGEPAGRIAFNNPIEANEISELITLLLRSVSRVGAAVVVMAVIYSGFLFVKAQGDPGELEKAKKTLLWSVIGGVILLGAEALAAVISQTATGLGAGIL